MTKVEGDKSNKELRKLLGSSSYIEPKMVEDARIMLESTANYCNGFGRQQRMYHINRLFFSSNIKKYYGCQIENQIRCDSRFLLKLLHTIDCENQFAYRKIFYYVQETKDCLF